jgi:hypothetical protein
LADWLLSKLSEEERNRLDAAIVRKPAKAPIKKKASGGL